MSTGIVPCIHISLHACVLPACMRATPLLHVLPASLLLLRLRFLLLLPSGVAWDDELVPQHDAQLIFALHQRSQGPLSGLQRLEVLVVDHILVQRSRAPPTAQATNIIHVTLTN